MAKRSWPFGVTSWDDTVKFTQLVFGTDVNYENYGERLPHRSEKSFLLFAKGACGVDTSLNEVADLMVPQLQEIHSQETQGRFSERPFKSQQVLQKDGTPYYWTAQLTRVA